MNAKIEKKQRSYVVRKDKTIKPKKDILLGFMRYSVQESPKQVPKTAVFSLDE